MPRTYSDLRSELLNQIKATRQEYFRLKSELNTIKPRLPQGIYIGNYLSNYKWRYHSLGHKDAVLPSATDPNKGTKKLHLGHDHNPKYRLALLEVEQVRLKQIKEDTLEGITKHLNALKVQWRYLKSLRHAFKPTEQVEIDKTPEGKLFSDFVDAVQGESVFNFILRQHHSRTDEEE